MILSRRIDSLSASSSSPPPPRARAAREPPGARAQTHVREVRVQHVEARGPCWARHLAQQLWAGEEYYLQASRAAAHPPSPPKAGGGRASAARVDSPRAWRLPRGGAASLPPVLPGRVSSLLPY
jgi:hypothetical protein